MHLLLDTHVAVWAVNNPARLPRTIQDLITDPLNLVSVSAVTIWELAIKVPLGRKDTPSIGAGVAISEFGRAGFEILPVTAAHAARVETLPRLHGDPFDRMLVAQALVEPLRLVTADKALAAYSEATIVF